MTQVNASAVRASFKAPPDSLIATFMLAFLATAGLFYVNIMPAIVSGVMDGLGVTERQAGYVASANIYGAAAGALIAVLLVRYTPWRPASLAALCVLIGIDLASGFVHDLNLLIGVRFCHGLIGGGLVGIVYGVFSRTKSPDRLFGMLLFVQYGLGGLGVMFLPGLAPVFGTKALFFSLAAFSLVALAMLPFLGAYEYVPPKKGDPKPKIQVTPLLLSLVAIFLFQLGNMGLAAYMIELGRRYELSTDFASGAIGAASWVALIGPALIVMVGTRFGRWKLLVGAIFCAVVGTLAFHWSADPIVFIAANCVTGIAWAFVIAYLLGMAAEFDRGGRTAAAAGFVSKMGLASGPFIAGVLIESRTYPFLINVSALVLALSAVSMLWPALLSDRARRAAAVATTT